MLSRVYKWGLFAVVLTLAFSLLVLPADATDIKIENWGIYQGEEIYLCTLTNDTGVELKVTNYGGRITSIYGPVKDGRMIDVVLGFDSLEEYLNNPNDFGAVMGRSASRIPNGQFTLAGKTYHINQTDKNNHLHGASAGFDQRIWNIKAVVDNGRNIILGYRSQDGENGYPGNLDIEVSYTLTDNNAVIINYRAVTDHTTICDLTNHTYFNFNGAADKVLNHELMINADTFTPVDNEWIPNYITQTIKCQQYRDWLPASIAQTVKCQQYLGNFTLVDQKCIPHGVIADLDGSPLDFRDPRRIGERINNDLIQLKKCHGYNQNYVLNTAGNINELAASLYDPSTGLAMDVYTTEPGLKLYTANFLDGSITGRNGNAYNEYSALCLEPQHFPDSPNVNYFPSTVLRPGEVYDTTTIYSFYVK